jgi:hypothetical protein
LRDAKMVEIDKLKKEIDECAKKDSCKTTDG